MERVEESEEAEKEKVRRENRARLRPKSSRGGHVQKAQPLINLVLASKGHTG